MGWAGRDPIFPIQIFRVKKGIILTRRSNYEPVPEVCRVSSKGFSQFCISGCSVILEFYNPNDYRTEIAYMGCRTRVVSNVLTRSSRLHTAGQHILYDNQFAQAGDHRQQPFRRRSVVESFYEMLTARLNQVCEQLLERYAIQLPDGFATIRS